MIAALAFNLGSKEAKMETWKPCKILTDGKDYFLINDNWFWQDHLKII